VKMKYHKSLHNRALVMYRDILNLSLARSRLLESSETLSSQCQTHESTELTSSMECVSREHSGSSQVQTLDEKFDKMLQIQLPETVDEESTSYIDYCSRAHGEPSGPSCEILSIFGTPTFEEIWIFDKPRKTDEVFVTPRAHSYEKLQIEEESEGRDSILLKGRRNSHWSKVRSNMIRGARDEEFSCWDISDVKIDLCNELTPKAVDFPEKDFKHPIQWMIDGITYEARNVSELRSKHDIATEGIFKKRYKCHTWRSYYGIFFNMGIMIYFKKHVFKKVADFRKSTVTIPKGKQLRLNIDDVHVASRITNWQLKFESVKQLNTWYKTILKFSKGLKTEVDRIRQSVGSPMNFLSKLI
jgi:hypothetical protein